MGRQVGNNKSSVSFGAVFAGLFFAVALYCATDPFKHSAIADFPDFETYYVELPSWSQIPTERDSSNLLQKSKIMFKDEVQGPESVSFDPQGRGPYTGVADGGVLFWNGESWTDFASTSSNRSEICDPKPSILSYSKNEHICGRPLGLRFDEKTGHLYIADAYFGLMKVGPEGGLATSVSTEAEGVPFKFTNDLDVDDEGNVYFTDTSTNDLASLEAEYPRLRKFLLKLPISAKFQFLLHIGGRPHGVVVKYSPQGKLLQILEDSEGKVVKAASEVEEKDGKLWIGSVLMSFVAVYDLH
ncbi:protein STRICTOSIDINE SYNTHASE-LIKE 3-like [Cucurbita moschata]|uniref:Protein STRICTOSIDINE SYNTHASE-LIKE 3-like n=1 Tax=Cucurbita moschata TaxID=3662 RepID=A0A6J1E652_CUCMO|nr:protein STRICTOSIDINE SYNTHASE-LIKE 3-like [Cucurbita moschata]